MMSVAVQVSLDIRKPISVFEIGAKNILSKYVGESDKLVYMLYKIAAEFSPSIIIIDEVSSYQ